MIKVTITQNGELLDAIEFDADNVIASIVATCKLNDVNPVAYIAETLEAIVAGHPQNKIEDLMPWRFRKISSPHQ